MKRQFYLILLIILVLSYKSSAIEMSDSSHGAYDSKNHNDTINIGARDENTDMKGPIFLHISFPYINSFLISPQNESVKANTGFMGYSIGLDYCYKKNQYVSFSISKILDSNTPIVFIPKMEEYELLGSDYLISLSNNHIINRFTLGYGLSFAQNYWEIVNNGWEDDGIGREPVRKSHNAIGCNLSSFFRVSEIFQIGIVYRPSFFRFNTDPGLQYEHSISIDFACKIPLRKK